MHVHTMAGSFSLTINNLDNTRCSPPGVRNVEQKIRMEQVLILDQKRLDLRNEIETLNWLFCGGFAPTPPIEEARF